MKSLVPILILMMLLCGLYWFPSEKAVPIALSCISMLISGYVFWLNKFSPPVIRVVQTGRVVLTRNPQSLLKRSDALAIEIHLLFHNNGGSVGYIESAGLKVFGPKRDTWVGFRGLLFHEDDKLNWGKELPPPQMSTFKTFGVMPGTSTIKNILFAQIDEAESFSTEPGKYNIKIYYRTVGSNSWNEVDEVEIEVTPNDVTVIKEGIPIQQPDGSHFVKLALQSIEVQSQKLAYDRFNDLKVNE